MCAESIAKRRAMNLECQVFAFFSKLNVPKIKHRLRREGCIFRATCCKPRKMCPTALRRVQCCQQWDSHRIALQFWSAKTETTPLRGLSWLKSRLLFFAWWRLNLDLTFQQMYIQEGTPFKVTANSNHIWWVLKKQSSSFVLGSNVAIAQGIDFKANSWQNFPSESDALVRKHIFAQENATETRKYESLLVFLDFQSSLILIRILV